MKKNLLQNLFILIFLLTFRFSEAQSIINSGFESWSNNSLSRLDVDGWLTSNMQYSGATVVQDVPYSGSHSAKMVSIYDAGAGSYVGGDMSTAETYLTGHPQPGSLKLYLKQNVQSLFDNTLFLVTIFDSLSNAIGTATSSPPPLTNYPAFTLFNVPISYSSSANMWGYSVFISFYPATQSNAVWAAVDNIYFDIASGIEEDGDLEKWVLVYPSPASNQITVQTADMKIDGMQIYNMVGEKIISFSYEQFSAITKENFSIDISALPAGLYIVEAKSDNQIARKKFVKE